MCSRFALKLILLISLSVTVHAQFPERLQPDPPPQTARQALLEMIFANDPAQFLKHLPKDMQEIMRHDSGVLPLSGFSAFMFQLQMPGRELETFDSGPVFLRVKDPDTQQTIEI